MSNSNKSFLLKRFSHIYVEKEASRYPVTAEILANLPDATVISIQHYKDVFSRGHQDFGIQKQSPKLILAVKSPPYIYRTPSLCQDFGHKDAYYVSSILNCPYSCSYCYLQGMYPSANLVVFVNIADFATAINDLQAASMASPPLICLSYDTDLLGLEPVIPFARKWAALVPQLKNYMFEIRTKSANPHILAQLKPAENLILAWTLTPTWVHSQYEKGTSSPEMRIKACKNAILAGHNVRICLDPILYCDGFDAIYCDFIDQIFTQLSAKDLLDVSFGTFRIPRDYLKIAKKHGNHALFFYPFDIVDHTAVYPKHLEKHMSDVLFNQLLKYFPGDQIFQWASPSSS